VRLLGFTDRVGELLAASDLFVSPVRYEAFGLNVLEALCRGVSSIVSKAAGVAEVYPPETERWLLENPEDVGALSRMLRDWNSQAENARGEFAALGEKLRAYTMRDMAEKIIAAAQD
jgi:glycosyltransferase involved in cell wall biosynthesis